jgi:hypothetical protein
MAEITAKTQMTDIEYVKPMQRNNCNNCAHMEKQFNTWKEKGVNWCLLATIQVAAHGTCSKHERLYK